MAVCPVLIYPALPSQPQQARLQPFCSLAGSSRNGKRQLYSEHAFAPCGSHLRELLSTTCLQMHRQRTSLRGYRHNIATHVPLLWLHNNHHEGSTRRGSSKQTDLGLVEQLLNELHTVMMSTSCESPVRSRSNGTRTRRRLWAHTRHKPSLSSALQLYCCKGDYSYWRLRL